MQNTDSTEGRGWTTGNPEGRRHQTSLQAEGGGKQWQKKGNIIENQEKVKGVMGAHGRLWPSVTSLKFLPFLCMLFSFPTLTLIPHKGLLHNSQCITIRWFEINEQHTLEAEEPVCCFFFKGPGCPFPFKVGGTKYMCVCGGCVWFLETKPRGLMSSSASLLSLDAPIQNSPTHICFPTNKQKFMIFVTTDLILCKMTKSQL